jgi:hypothetical protein
MHRGALFCKSYRYDFPRLRQLLTSCERYAPETPILISVPRADTSALRQEVPLASRVSVVEDEAYVPEGAGDLPGWWHQQVCKLSVHRLGFANSIYALDSDFYFVARFGEDVFTREGRPCIVASRLSTHYTAGNTALHALLAAREEPAAEDEEARLRGTLDNAPVRLVEALRAASRMQGTDAMHVRATIPIIHQTFGIRGRPCFQPSQIYHHEFLVGLEAYFASLGLSVVDLIRIAPWENIWYGAFVMARFPLALPVRSQVLHFASEADVVAAKRQGLDECRIAGSFHAVAMASRHFERLFYA